MIEIIPAIDVIDGKCVRLTQGDFAVKTIYAENPIEVARCFEKSGLRCLHLVDLDGAKQGRIVNHAALREITLNTRLSVEFGGGISSESDLQSAFSAGASQVICGSVAVKDPALFEAWLGKYGPEKIVLAADVRQELVALSGWQASSQQHILEFLKYYLARGVEYVLCTDIECDGVLQGPAFGLYQKMMDAFPATKLIASGGVSSIEDIRRLEEIGVYAVVVGKAIYEGKIGLKDLAGYKC